MKVERKTEKLWGGRNILENTQFETEDIQAFTREDVEEMKKYLEDLLEMHTDTHTFVAVFVSASFSESGAHARQRYYEQRRQELKKNKKEDLDEPI